MGYPIRNVPMPVFDNYDQAIRSLAYSVAAKGKHLIVKRGDQFEVIAESEALPHENVLGWTGELRSADK